MHIGKKDLAKDIVFFIIRTALSFGYCFLMLMLFSFITVSVLHLEFEWIIILSIIGTIASDIYYIWKKVRERSK